MYKKYALMLFSLMGALAVDFTLSRPAMAGWQSYGSTNPITSTTSSLAWRWTCGRTEGVPTNLASQVCVVRDSTRNYVRGAVIVRNNNSSLYSASASVQITNSTTTFDDSSCSSSGVGANSWSVCYGPWINWSSSVQAIGSTKCQLLPPTSYALIPHSQMRVAYLRDNQLERSIVQ
jgi:hypothetical protein